MELVHHLCGRSETPDRDRRYVAARRGNVLAAASSTASIPTRPLAEPAVYPVKTDGDRQSASHAAQEPANPRNAHAHARGDPPYARGRNGARHGPEYGRLLQLLLRCARGTKTSICNSARCCRAAIFTATICARPRRSSSTFQTATPRWVRQKFTFYGFRYVKLTKWAGEVRLDRFKGMVLYSDMRQTGTIETGNPLVNRLFCKHAVGPARQLSGRADRLPAARRAHGLDGRRAGVFRHGRLQHGRRRVFRQVSCTIWGGSRKRWAAGCPWWCPSTTCGRWARARGATPPRSSRGRCTCATATRRCLRSITRS